LFFIGLVLNWKALMLEVALEDAIAKLGGAGCSRFTYGEYIYAPEKFNDQKSHTVRISKNQGAKGANGVRVFIYGN